MAEVETGVTPGMEAKTEGTKDGGYDRDAEKNQEIGDEFLNPDKDMEEAATKIQGSWRKRQKKR